MMCGIVGEGFWGSHTAYIQDPPPRTTVALAGDGTRCFSFQQVPPLGFETFTHCAYLYRQEEASVV